MSWPLTVLPTASRTSGVHRGDLDTALKLCLCSSARVFSYGRFEWNPRICINNKFSGMWLLPLDFLIFKTTVIACVQPDIHSEEAKKLQKSASAKLEAQVSPESG